MLVLFIGGYSYVQATTMSALLPYLSEFRLIRPRDGISELPLPITRLKNRVFFSFSRSTLDEKCLFRTVKPLQHLAEFQAPHLILDCLMSLFRYPLFGQSHRELITLPTSQNFKLSKNFILSNYNIYLYIT